jgi:hypothetical protein
MTVPDNTDLPDDRNPCTNDFCTGGAPSHTMLPAGGTCGGANVCNTTGQCVGCVNASTCPGTDNACQTRTCTGQGVCGITFRAAGTRLTDPTVGDCKGLQCDGAGNSAPVNDNADLPVDGNPCTTDECSAGTPAHRPVASGTTCGAGVVCDGANRCVQCLSASTCPGTDTECRPRSCVDGACGFTNTRGGTVIAAQVARDCKRIVCDGAGSSFTVAEVTDLPVDNNPCTSDLCTGDTPSNPALAAGTNCGGTSVCDGMRVCVGCLTAATCPGTDTECHSRTCSASHQCGLLNVPLGMLLALQTVGDCKRDQCDGNGNAQTVDDNADVPGDGNQCTMDLCMAGVPSHMPVASGVSCGTGLLCNGAGVCVGCRTVSDCPAPSSACQMAVCTATGQCQVANMGAGTLVPPQTTGDCKRNQCDGMGNAVLVADDSDRPVDGNTCTQDVCTQGNPSNPAEPQNTACTQNNGSRCNGIPGAEACVQCITASDCPGSDNECHTRVCTAAGQCSVQNTADGTALSAQLDGDCKRSQCSGGAIVSVTDANDLPIDFKGCTQDLCTGSTPSNPPQPPGTACSESSGSRCNAIGICVQCNNAGECPGGPDTECHTRVCNNGMCSIQLTAEGTPVAAQSNGDCQVNVCGATGTIVSIPLTSDVFVDGKACTADSCNGGMPQNSPLMVRTPCTENGGAMCDGAGTCAQCVADSDCDARQDTVCNKIRCLGGSCAYVHEPATTPVADMASGDCQRNVCDPTTGLVTTMPDETDVPSTTNACAIATCLGGMPSFPGRPHGTSCAQNGGRTCDGAGSCLLTFSVVRLGDGATVLSSGATPVLVEERLAGSGAAVTSTSGALQLPTVASGATQPFTLSGTADSEGALTLSTDGRYLTLIGYAATIPTVAVKGAVLPRVIARIDGSFVADTTTTLGGFVSPSPGAVPSTALAGDNARSVLTQDGQQFWAAGNGSPNANRGVWYTSPSGATTAAIQLSGTNSRVCNIFFGQLYCATNAALTTLGTGIPVPPSAVLVPVTVPGMAVPTLFGFAMFDLVAPFDGAPDTIYVADERVPTTVVGMTGGGIQKWTFSGTTWSLASTFNLDPAGMPLTAGVHGFAAIQSGSNVILIGTTIEPAGNHIVAYVDDGITTPSTVNASWIQTAPSNQIFRGVAFSPHL